MAYQYKLTWTDIPDDMVEEETYNQEKADYYQAFKEEAHKHFKETVKKIDRDYFQSVQDEHGKSPDVTSATEWRITEECNALKDLLISKNRKYGDSALDTGVFNISPIVALKARIQDKLNRLKNDNKDEDEDIVLDLLGYFILLRIAIKEERENRDF